MIRKIFAAIWIFVTALLFILANGREAPSAQTPDDDTKANAEILQHVQSFVFRHPKIGLHGIAKVRVEYLSDKISQIEK